ncbi:MAG: 4Fe-4S dicluster domain-containing protein [Anaerolineae bacterium]|nr:4Fe-4S dicluster domain-containing protein [Anaerolineae bacterium]
MADVQTSAKQGHLEVDEDHCIACQACMVACSLVHEGEVIPSLARIQIVLNALTAVNQVRYCRQCEDAPCAEACPQEAIQWQEGGYWAIDEELCVGCGLCAEACPYDAIVMDDRRGIALKCDTCQGEPACVASCPRGVLTWKV